MGLDDAWMEEALVAISLQGASDVQFQAVTETINFTGGQKDFDQIVLLNGGRIMKWNPETEHEVELVIYPSEAGTDSGTTGKGFYDLLSGSSDSSQPVILNSSRTRNKVRLIALWTNDTSITTAQAAVNPSNKGIRFIAADGYVISAEQDFTDGILKWTVRLKFPPFDSSGSANIQWESSDGTATLDAISSYTSSVKFRS